MKRQSLCFVIIFVLITSFLLAACSQTSTAPGTSTKSSATQPTQIQTTSSQANWWDKFGTPEYGGTLNIRSTSIGGDFDPHSPNGVRELGVYERLFGIDWALDRNTWGYKIDYIPPDYSYGLLVQSWKFTDPTTMTLNIRQGVHWQDKAPVNGREMTSEDIVYTYDRILGTGHGFTQPNGAYGSGLNLVSSVTAADKYTVQIKLKRSSIIELDQIINGDFGEPAVIPHEIIEMGTAAGTGISNWKNAAGTGPWLLAEFVSGNSITFNKNTNYWGTDERHPQNKIPYADSLKYIGIPDISSAIAALRTGKVDIIPADNGFSLRDAQTLSKSNPEIQQGLIPARATELELRCDKTPFTDVRVRQALNMAIDRPAIAKSVYLGYVDGTPSTLINPVFTEWDTPFAQWPSDVQQLYTYNKDKAKQLLADAGYPNGFKTNVVCTQDAASLLEIIKSEFNDIGVDLEIKVMADFAAYGAAVFGGNQDQIAVMSWLAISDSGPGHALNLRQKKTMANLTHNNDDTFEAMVNQFEECSPDEKDKAIQIFKEANMYALKQCWAVNIFGTVSPIAWQPYLKGFSGETTGRTGAQIYARLWIDKTAK